MGRQDVAEERVPEEGDTKRFVPRIESVRGIAALAVAIGHVMGWVLPGDYFVPLQAQTNLRDFLLKAGEGLFNGQTAVIVFFVISGFVIGRSLDAKPAPLSSGSYGRFLIRRALRLYPANFAAVIGITCLGLMTIAHTAPFDFTRFPQFAAYPSWWAQWYDGTVFHPLKARAVAGNLLMGGWTLNPPAWSLYVEVVVAPLLPLFHILSRKRSPWLDCGLLGALLVLAVTAWPRLWSMYWFVFYAGMMVETWGEGWARWLERRLGGTGPAAGLSYLLMMIPDAFTTGRPIGVIVIEAFAAFNLVSLIAWSRRAETFSFLDLPAIRWNGRVSYSFYLWHYFILTLVTHDVFRFVSPAAMARHDLLVFLAALAVTVGVTLCIAHLSFALFERPFMRIGRREDSAFLGSKDQLAA